MAPKFTYHLSLAPEVSAYRPEIEYVCALLAEAHGLVRDDTASCVLHYGSAPPDGAVAVPAVLFTAATRIDEDGLHLDRAKLESVAAQLLPRADARQFDAIGLVFLLVSRLEERDYPDGDRYGRYPHHADFQVRHGLFGRAGADEALLALAQAITAESTPPQLTRYQVQPTHDVDRLRAYHRLSEPLRTALGDLLKRRQPRQALERLRSYGSREPWPSFIDVMDLSERHGLTSRFYFMGPSRHRNDSPYVADMSGLLRRVADAVVQRGHALGFHPGHRTCSDAGLWQSQRAGLEAVLGRPVTEGRQHMLGYAAGITPDIWDQAGMHADYTLAYPEQEGFRTGSSRVLPAYSLRRRRQLALCQGSTPIMDFGLFGGKYRSLSIADALARCRPVIETTRRFGGTLTVLFHTGQPQGMARDFYEALLREAA